MRAEDAAACAALHAECFPPGWDAHEFESFARDPAVLADVALKPPGGASWLGLAMGPFGAAWIEGFLTAGPWRDGMFGAGPRRAPLVGFSVLRAAADEAEILSIAVSAAARGMGAGAALLNVSIARAAGAGARSLFLEVAEDNGPARSLYARHGFEPVGRRRGYYAAPGRDALVMRLALD